MNDYLTSITPDSLSGIIFAFEGVSRSVVLLNGPTGCKYYHSSISDNQMIRQKEFDPLNFPATWYFGQPRVPCTFLDNDDYIYGSMDKLDEALEYLRDNVPFDLLCIVNSPGAALIGDDLQGIARRILGDRQFITVETPGYSSDVCSGYELAAMRLIESFGNERVDEGNVEKESSEGDLAGEGGEGNEASEGNEGNEASEGNPQSVNILGLSIFHRNGVGDALEIKRLMELCGIQVNCVLCAGSDLQSIARIGDAALNIVIHPEYGIETARLLQTRYDMPYYICDGPPVGFSATQELMEKVCFLLGADISPFTEDCERARARAYTFISRLNSLTGLPKGTSFAVEGTYSEVYAYTSFFVRYFGMVPECAAVMNPERSFFRDGLYELLDEFGVSDAFERDIMETQAQLVFASGNSIAGLKLRKHEFSGIETALPSLGYLDVIPKTYLGIQGALMLVELVLNGMVF